MDRINYYTAMPPLLKLFERMRHGRIIRALAITALSTFLFWFILVVVAANNSTLETAIGGLISIMALTSFFCGALVILFQICHSFLFVSAEWHLAYVHNE